MGKFSWLGALGLLWMQGCSPSRSELEPKPKPLLQEARALAGGGRSDEAISLLKDYRRDHPRALGVNFTLGTVYLGAAKDRNAATCFEAELDLKPNHLASLAQLGLAYERLGRTEEVVDCFRRQAELSPDDWKPRHQAGLVLRKYLGRLSEAEAELTRAIRCNPKGQAARIELGRTWMDMERFEDAERLFRETLGDHSESPEAHLHLGQLLVRSGKETEGQAHLQLFKELAARRDRLTQLVIAGTAASQCLAGEEWLRLRNWRKALGAFQKALDLDSAATCGYIGVGRVHAGQGKYREALALYRRARELAPQHFDVAYHSALALAGLKREQEAVRAIDAAQAIREFTAGEAREAGSLFLKVGFSRTGQALLDQAPSGSPRL